MPFRDAGVGLQLRGHTCGPDRIAHVRSEMGFDVNVECSPSKSSKRQKAKRTIKINIATDRTTEYAVVRNSG